MSQTLTRSLTVLIRQKISLALLERAGHTLSRTVFVKLAFLLRQETELLNDRTYYDFVPYKFGPFSFALYRELSLLERDGYVLEEDKKLRVDLVNRRLVRQNVEQLAKVVQSSVAGIVARYAGVRQCKLLQDVYARYPWYARKSERIDLVPNGLPPMPEAAIAVYTVGYEGKSVDGFFDGLLRTGIRVILDVRANPVSRKYGFAKKSLNEIATKLDLEYHHLPELGIIGEERAELGDFDSYQLLLDRYERQMLPERTDHIEHLTNLVRQKPSALLCVEKDVRCCHRGRLAEAVASLSGLPIIHL